MAIRAEVLGLGSAAGPFTVTVSVSYEAAGGALVPLPVSRESIPIGEGRTQTQETFQVLMNPCLSDSERAQAASGGCQLRLTLVLRDAEGELASETVDLGLVRKGDQVAPPTAIRLVPSYTLSITGGGAGTGNGRVLVPEVADQPALDCEISAGVAAETGCSGRYPAHTVLTLTPSSGVLEAWGSDCDAVAATDPCQLTLDDRRIATASFTVPRTTGDLTVQIAGLPEGALAQVTVTNTRGYSQVLTETTTLTDLAPGNDYRITAAPVTVAAEERTYAPDPAEQQVTVVADSLTTAQIGYNPPETGSLAVEIVGLPAGVSALVSVTGPSFDQPRILTAGETLAPLEPGTYTITAGPLETAEQVYAATPPTQPVRVVAGATTQATVSYSATRGSLTVAVSGLPDGFDAAITVTGPGGFSRAVPATLTLVKLVPGTYEVAAGNVRAGGKTFASGLPTQSIVVTAGSDLLVTVGYGALLAVRLEKLKGDGEICVVNTFCPDMFRARALDAAGSSVADAKVRWTAGEATEGCPEGSHTDVRTGADGVAHASNQCKYHTPGSYTQTAVLVIDQQVVPGTDLSFSFRLVIGPPSSALSAVQVSPAALRTCCDTATVTVTARDAAGNVLSGAKVVLEASSSAVTIQAQPSETTSAGGVTTGRVIGRANGTAQIAARIDGVLLDNTAAVTVSAGIAFADDGDIFAVSQEGVKPANLTRGIEGEASLPAWAPDGSRIAFTVRRCVNESCFKDIYVMRTDGSDTLNLTASFGQDGSAPTWSPDGGRIAFQADSGIYVMQATGSVATNITPGVSGASSPDWSRDGSRIVFVMDVCGEGCARSLATMDPSGAKLDTLSPPSLGAPGEPKWSPDGGKIAFTLAFCPDGCDSVNVAVVSAGGLDLVNLTGDLENFAFSPAWSPGGGRIAFTRDTCNDGCFEVYLMSSRDGSALIPLVPGSEPSWR